MMRTKTYLTIVILSTLVIEGIFAKALPTSECPPGLGPVQCFVDPCSTSKCPGDPNAQCLSIYCGGCNAIWLTTGGALAQCDSKCKCPPGQDEVQCIKDPCDGATCPGDSTAKCYSNYCGGCNAVWLTPDNKLANCLSKSVCPLGKKQVNCYVDPCKGKACDGYPDAKGVPNYCGGCTCDWFLPDGTPVKCGAITS